MNMHVFYTDNTYNARCNQSKNKKNLEVQDDGQQGETVESAVQSDCAPQWDIIMSSFG